MPSRSARRREGGRPVGVPGSSLRVVLRWPLGSKPNHGAARPRMAARRVRTTLRFMQGPLHVLIAGAGVAALEATLALKALAEERVDIEVLAPETDFVYRPLAVAEPFGKGEVRSFPVGRLVELAGARLTPGALESVDLGRRRARTADSRELPWDVLVLA